MAVSGVLCLTASPSRHPRQRGQAGDGVYPRRLIHGGHGEHDRRQRPGQLRERDCHHPELPRWSAWYGLASMHCATSTARQWDKPPWLTGLEPAGKGAVGGMGPARMGAALHALPLLSTLAAKWGGTWQVPQWAVAVLSGSWHWPPQAHLHNLAKLKANIGLWLSK